MTTPYREITRKDWLETIVYLALWLALVGLGAIFLLPAYWYIWLTLIVVGLFWLVYWHARNFAYRCSHCEHVFEISPWRDFISPNGLSLKGEGWKYLKCPHCQTRSRATELRVIK
jgi:hypothetical protein